MSLGISPKLPLELDTHVGSYKLNKTHKETIKQNFKNLVLTNPGERIMDTRFGVGIRRFLFENRTEDLKFKITSAIEQQVKLYMPFLIINQVLFLEDDDTPTDPNALEMTINYSIPALNSSDFLEISVWYD